jgi:hypothetical protein
LHAAVATPPLVGEWQRVNRCRPFVRAFKKAGLEQLAPEWLVGGGYRSGSIKQVAKDPHPCRGAKAFKHSHAFYPDGKFASFTARGQQVDNGTYKIIDNRTFRLLGAPGFKVRYSVTGDTIRYLRVIAPHACKSKSCRENHATSSRPSSRVPRTASRSTVDTTDASPSYRTHTWSSSTPLSG